MYEIRNKYNIYEINTNQIIHSDTNKKKVKKKLELLKGGSGFSGNTPAFFSNNYVQIKDDIKY